MPVLKQDKVPHLRKDSGALLEDTLPHDVEAALLRYQMVNNLKFFNQALLQFQRHYLCLQLVED